MLIPRYLVVLLVAEDIVLCIISTKIEAIAVLILARVSVGASTTVCPIHIGHRDRHAPKMSWRC